MYLARKEKDGKMKVGQDRCYVPSFGTRYLSQEIVLKPGGWGWGGREQQQKQNKTSTWSCEDDYLEVYWYNGLKG